MNNKIKMGLAFMALFFVLSPQAKEFRKITDINWGHDIDLEMTKNITLKELKDDTNLHVERFYKFGSCLISSHDYSYIRKGENYTVGMVAGSRKPKGWVITMIAIENNFLKTYLGRLKNSFSIGCLLPDTGQKARKDLTTEDITKASNGLITFN